MQSRRLDEQNCNTQQSPYDFTLQKHRLHDLVRESHFYCLISRKPTIKNEYLILKK